MKTYWLTLGDGSITGATFTGLSPTFITFINASGGTGTPPAISEIIAGTGVYSFTYGPTLGMYFVVDWGVSVPSTYRYTKGSLDPLQAVDERIGGILDNNDSFGSTSVDPTTVIGFLKRLQELGEGNALYTKATGIWQIFSRGSSTLLREKTLTDSTSTSTKT